MTDEAGEVAVVYTTHDVYPAEILRSKLHDAGIACELVGETQGGFTHPVETKLLVRTWDADHARRVIEDGIKDKFEPPRDEVKQRCGIGLLTDQ